MKANDSLDNLGVKMLAYGHLVLLCITSHGLRQLHVSVTQLLTVREKQDNSALTVCVVRLNVWKIVELL